MAFRIAPWALAAALLPLPGLAAPVRVLPEAAVPFDAAPDRLRAGPALRVSVPGGRDIDFHVEVHEEPGIVALRGRSYGSDRMSLFLAGEVFSGDIHATGGRFRLVRHGGAFYWVPQADYPPELAELEGPDGAVSAPAPESSAGAEAVAPVAVPAPDGKYEVDLLVLYSPLYADRIGGKRNVLPEAKRLVFVANGYFGHNAMPVRYRLVGAEPYGNAWEQASFGDNLDRIAADPVVRGLRDRYRADLVALFRTVDNNFGICGIARVFNGAKRYLDDVDNSQPPDNVDPDRDGFSVNGMGPRASDGVRCPDYVFAHELGHNMGAGHDIAVSGFSWKSYSHGWDCGNAGAQYKYASIMHYGYLALEARGDFYSDPRLFLDGQPCGMSGVRGTEVTEADNALAISQAAPYVAAYRGAARASGSATPEGGAAASGGAAGAGLLLAFAIAAWGRARRVSGRR